MWHDGSQLRVCWDGVHDDAREEVAIGFSRGDGLGFFFGDGGPGVGVSFRGDLERDFEMEVCCRGCGVGAWNGEREIEGVDA